jgi:ferredoxin--NADP+ reductase
MTFRKPDGSVEVFRSGLVLRAVGYRGLAFCDLPYDESRGTLVNERGRIMEQANESPMTGLYCSGWIKRGPSGGIGTNKVDSAETVEALWEDFVAGHLADPVRELSDLVAYVAERQPAMVDKDAWLRIDAAERKPKEGVARPRANFVTIGDMLAAARPNAQFTSVSSDAR